MEQTRCRYNRPLRHNKKCTEKNLNIKAVTMVDTVTGWFIIMQYKYKRTISIVNLVETTWLTRYPRPMKINYDQGSEFIIHGLRKPFIKI